MDQRGKTPGKKPAVHVGFVVDKVAPGQVFSPSTSVFPCQFHSTVAPLLGKMKKTNLLSLHLHHKSCTISLKAAMRPQLLLRGFSPQKENPMLSTFNYPFYHISPSFLYMFSSSFHSIAVSKRRNSFYAGVHI